MSEINLSKFILPMSFTHIPLLKTKTNPLAVLAPSIFAGRILVLAMMLFLPLVVSATTYPVTTTADSGAGSLREAIGLANANAGDDIITFTIAGTLIPSTALPTITGGLTVDGTTAPGYVAGAPTFVIENPADGSSLQYTILANGATNLTITGLSISNTSPTIYGNGISITDCTNVNVTNNLINNHYQGVLVSGGSSVTIANNSWIGTGDIDSRPAIHLNSVSAPLSMSQNIFGGTSGTALLLNDMTDVSIGSANTNDIVLADTDGLKDIANGTNAVLYFNNCSNLSIDDIDLTRSTTAMLGLGIKMVNCTGILSVTNCDIGYRYRGVEASGTGKLILTGNNVTNSGLGNTYGAFDLNALDSIAASANTFGGIGATALRIDNMPDLEIGSAVTNDIVLTDTDGLKDIAVGTNAVLYLNSCSNLTIDDVNLTRSTTTMLGIGINMVNCSGDLSVTNSDIGYRYRGVDASGAGSLTLTGNNVTNSGLSDTYGAFDLNDLDAIAASNNTFGGIGATALRIDNMPDLEIGSAVMNDIVLTDTDGLKDIAVGTNAVLYFNNCSNLTIDDVNLLRTATSMLGIGIRLNDCAGMNSVTNSDIAYRYRAVEASGAGSLTLTGNNVTNSGLGNTYGAFDLNDLDAIAASNNTFGGIGITALRLDNMPNIGIGSANTNNIVIANTDGLNAMTASGSNAVIYVGTNTNSTVNDVDLSNPNTTMLGNGITISNTGTHSITNCKINHRYRGVHLIGAGDFTVTDNDLTNSGLNNQYGALTVEGANSISATGNTWAGTATALSLDGMDGILIGNQTIGGGNITIEDGSGFATSGSSNYPLIYLNDCSNTTIDAVDLQGNGSGSGFTINDGSGNIVQNLTVDNRDFGGKLIGGTTGNTITCLTITNVNYGLEVSETGNTIEQNTFACVANLAIHNTTNPAISITAENNFYGYDADPVAGDFSGTVDFDPFLSDADACAPDGSADCAELEVPPAPATALDFDGADDYIRSENRITLFGSQPTTVEFWMNADVITSRKSPIGIGTNRYYFFQPGTWSLWGENTFNQKSFGESLPTNTWTHVAITYDGVNTLSLYLDGEPAATPTHTQFIGGINDFIYIGHRGDLAVGSIYYDGGIDEVRVWTQERSAAEILANYNTELDVMPPCLALYYKLNQGFVDTDNAGEIIADDTATNLINNGNLNGFTLTGSTSNWTEGAGITAVNSVYDPFSEIAITGNGQNIADGDNNPTAADGTDFGTVTVGQTASATFTITNSGTGDLDLTAYSSDQAEFTIAAGAPTVITAGQTADFTVIFTPTNDTPVNGTITIANNDCDEDPYSFAVTGMGQFTPAEALNFDGSNDRVIAGDIDALDGISQMTYEAWIQLESFPVGGDHKGIVGKVLGGDGNTISWLTVAPNGKIDMWLGNGSLNIATTPTGVLTVGTWHHVAAVFDGTQTGNANRLKIYIDGVVQPLSFSGTTPATTATTTHILQIGGLAAGRFIDGNIDEVRVWSTARCASEIIGYKDCELDGTETDLVAYYDFNQGNVGADNSAVTTLIDRTANGNDGTLSLFDDLASGGSTSNWIAPGGVVSSTACGPVLFPEITVNDDATGTNFGNVAVGATADITYTITNDGAADLDIASISVDNGLFTVPATMTSIVAGATFDFTVTYAPTSTGTTSGLVSIQSNDCDEDPYSFTVTGEGIPACDATITSIDVDANCPTSITVNATCSTCTGNLAYDVNGQQQQINDGFFDELIPGTYTVTVSDANDPSCNATSSVTIVADTEAPTVSCAGDIEVDTDAGDCTAAVSWTTIGQITFADNCGIARGTVNFGLGGGHEAVTDPNASIGGTYPVGPTPVTYRIYDAADLMAECSFNVIVSDGEAPIAGCQDISVAIGASGSYVLTAAEIQSGSTDNCDNDLDYSIGETVFFCGAIGTPQPVVLTATDDAGNAGQCTATVTVTDGEDPIANCIASLDLTLDASGMASISVADINDNSTDNCGISSLALSKDEFDCTDLGGNSEFALDFDDNDDHVSFGNQPQYDFTVNDAFTVETWLNPHTTSGGWHGFLSKGHWNASTGFLLYMASGSVYFVRMGSNYSTAVNHPISANTWTHIAAVYDQGAMTLYVNGVAVSSSAGNGVPYANSSTPLVIGGRNNNGGTGFQDFYPGLMDEVRIWNVARTDLDIAGLMNASLSGQEAGLVGYYPIENGPGSSTVNDLAMGNTANLQNMDPANDWVAGASNVGSGASLVTLTVTDDNGLVSTCTTEITILDAEAPITPTLADVTGDCEATATAPTTTDNCAGTITGTTTDPLTYTTQGTYTIEWTFDDGNGNVITVDQNVVVDDVTAPTASCQDVTVNLGVDGQADLFDGITTISTLLSDDFESEPIGVGQSSLINWDFIAGNVDVFSVASYPALDGGIALDMDGSPAQNATIESKSTFNLEAGKQYLLTFEHANNSFGGVQNNSLEVSLGAYVQTFLAPTDGGITEFKRSILFSPAQNESVKIRFAELGSPSAGGSILDNVVFREISGDIAINDNSSDNCSLYALEVNEGCFDCSDVGTVVVNLTAFDANGLSSSCTANVTVTEDEAPTALCADDFTVNLDATQSASVDAAAINDGSSDNCGTINFTLSGQTAYTCADLGQTYEVTLTVSDGNATSADATCSTMVTVGDADSNCCDAAIGDVTVTDEVCPGAEDGTITVTATCTTCTSIEYSIGDAFQASNVFADVAPGTYTVTIQDSGDAGCNATQSVTIDPAIDNTAPTLDGGCPATASITLNLCDEISVTPADLGLTATDNCVADPTITLSQTDFMGVGMTNVTVTLSDGTNSDNSCVIAVTTVENPDAFEITAGADDLGQECPDAVVTFSAATLLANDNITNGATLEVQEVNLVNSADGTITDNGDGTFTFTPASGFSGTVELTYIVKTEGDNLFFDGNGHFYEFISAPAISWENARIDAETMMLNGQSGYLATITSVEENTFIANRLLGNGWIGASDVENEGVWKWVTGPEAGSIFFGPGAIPGAYRRWSAGEPNNAHGGEDYGHLVGPTSPFGIPSFWNDLGNNEPSIAGYVVEYGNNSSCVPNLTATGNITLLIEDNESPVAPILSDITGACEATATPPTTTDNCAGTITGTTTDPTTYTVAGNYTINWIFDDGNGNEISVPQNVIVTAEELVVSCPSAAGLPGCPDPASCDITDFSYAIWNNQTGNSQIDGTITIGSETIGVTVFSTGGVYSDGGSIIDYTTSYGDNPYCGTAYYCPRPSGINDYSFRSRTLGEHRFVFDRPVENPRFFISSLNRVMNLSAQGILVESTGNFFGASNGDIVTSLDGRESCGTISFIGTFTEVSFTGLSEENWCDFSVGISQLTQAGTVCSFNLPACTSEADIATAYGLWAAGFEVSGGCNAQSNIADIPALPAYSCGEGIDLSFTLTATDDNNPSGVSCTSTFTVDAADPVSVSCPADEAIGPCIDQAVVDAAFAAWLSGFDFSGGCGANGTFSTETAPDAAGGSVTVTYTATDDCGETANCMATFTVNADTEDPAIPVLADVTGECDATATPPTTTDNCAGTITGTTTDPLTYTEQGTYSIEWTFDDGNGNVITADQNVIVEDVTAPVLTGCPEMFITVECDAIPPVPVVTATDNCDGPLTPTFFTVDSNPGDQFQRVYSWSITDAAGNSNSCSQTVTVQDATPPTAPVLADLTGECSVTVPVPTVEDNCAGTITGTTTDPVTYTEQGTYIIEWTFDDGNGNVITANQTVIVDDVTAPVAPVLADVTGECEATATAPTTTDNCAGTITGTTTDPLTYTAQGTHNIEWTFDDGNGNVITVNQQVVIQDVTAPEITCPADMVINTNPGDCIATLIYIEPVGTDNCAGAVTTLISGLGSGGTPSVGTDNVTYEVTDVAGLTAQCTFFVTVVDNEAPTVACLDELTISLDGAGSANVDLTDLNVVASDNCDTDLNVTLSQTTFGCDDLVSGNSNPGQTFAQVRVAHAGGTETYYVGFDNLTGFGAGLVRICRDDPNDLEIQGGSGLETWSWTDQLAPGTVVTSVEVDIYLAGDQFGRTTVYPYSLNGVAKGSAAVIDGGDRCANPTQTFVIDGADYIAGGSNGFSWNWGSSVQFARSLVPPAPPVVTITVTDDAGLSTTCETTITVEDNIAPTTPTLADVTGECEATATAPTTTDNCAGTITGTTSDPLTYTTQGTHTIVWTFDDGNGNVITANQTVIVDDVTDPATPTLADVTGECEATATAPTTTDNCAGTITGTTTDPLTYTDQGTHTIEWTFDDGNDNVITVNQTVIVEDNTAPTITCADDIATNNDNGDCSAFVTVPAPTITDNCYDDNAPAGTQADPFTSLAQAGSVIGAGTFFFDVDGTQFSTFVECGWVMIVSSPSTATTDLTRTTALVPQQNTLLPASVYADASIQKVRINATGGVGLPFDVESDNPGTLANLRNDISLHNGLTGGINEWTGVGAFRMVTACQNFGVGSLSTKIYQACGNGAGLHWMPTINSSGQWVTADFANGTSDLNIWVQAAAPVISLTNDITGTCDASGVYPVGTTTITWTATDAAGNMAQCTQDVTVNDAEAPQIDCPADVTVIATSAAGAVATYVDPAGTDNCPGASTAMTAGLASGSTFPIGTTPVEFTVTDAANTATSCTFNVTVSGTAPDILCPDDIIVDATAGACDATVDFTATETAGIPASIISYSIAPGSVFSVGAAVEVTATATNAVGTDACSFTVTVEDNEDPATPVLADVTGECEATATAPTTTDNCAGTITGTTSNPLTYTAQGTHTIEWTFNDGNGNEIMVNQTVIVDDVTDPATPTLADVTGECEATATAPTTTDNCAGTITGTTTDPLTYNAQGTYSITWTFDDGNGNVITAIQNVMVDDVTDPAAPVLADVTSECSATATAPTTTDNCAGTITGTTTDDLTYDAQGTYMITWSFDDGNGNVSTANQTVIVDDVTNPVATCPTDITMATDAGLCTAVVTYTASATDNCTSVPALSYSVASGTAFEKGSTPVTVTADDLNGNTATCTFNVIVNDGEAPVAACTDIDVVLVDRNTYTLTQENIDAIALGTSDNCPGVTYAITAGTLDYDCDDRNAQFTVTLTATDAANNLHTCEAIVTITDPNSVCNDPPVAVCNTVTVDADANCMGAAAGADFGLNSSDPDGDDLIFSVSPEGLYPLGTTPVTLTVSDGEFTATCTTSITVVDNTAPTAICVENILVSLAADGTASINTTDIDAGSFDNCSIQSLALDVTAFDCSNVGENTVELTVSDDAGLTNVCTTTVTVEDKVLPTAECQDITVQLDAQGTASITSADVAADGSCPGTITLYSGVNYTGTEMVLTFGEYNFPALNGVIGNDNTRSVRVSPGLQIEVFSGYIDGSPELTLTGDTPTLGAMNSQVSSVIVTCLGGAVTGNGFSDACGIANIDLSQTDFTCSNVGENVIMVTVTDVNNNINSCNATITVEDNVAPVAECQPVTIQLDENGAASVTAAQVDNGSDDACGIASLVLDITSFDCADLGDNTVELTVTDNNNNVSTCMATVTVEDNIAPTITGCSDDMTVNAVAGDCSALVGLSVPVIDDNCGTTIEVICAAPGSNIINNELGLFPVGTSTVLCIVTDAAGNADTCSFDITVIDAEDPIITNCPDDIVVNNDAGECGASVFYGIITASDNCPGVTLDPLSGHMVDGDDFIVGTTDVEFLATDAHGNSTTCAFTVTVNDNEDPTFTCPTDMVVSNDESECSAMVDLIAPEVMDNCAGDGVVFTSNTVFLVPTAEGATSTFPIGTTTVTATAADIHGNTVSCTFTVTVNDDEAPLFPTCPRDPIVVSAAADVCGAFVDYDDIIIDDNCFGATITSFSHNVAGDDFDLGTTTVTITGSDAAGNGSVCSFEVTVVDDVAPQAFCIPATVSLDANGQGTLTIDQVLGDATDNCGLSNTAPTLSNNSFSCADIGSQSVTVTVTDVNGNVGSCVAEVSVVDEVAPTAICVAATVSLDAGGQASITAAELDGGSSDICSDVTISIPPTNFNCGSVGPNDVTLTVTDASGNTASCTSIVTVIDEVLPVAVCAPVSVALNANGNGSINAIDLDAGSNDACGITNYGASQTDFGCADVGTMDVTLSVTDNNGNTSTCVSTVTVTDPIAPALTCQDATIELDGTTGTAMLATADVTASATDACGVQTLELDRAAFDCSATTSNNVVTLTATDNNGNSSSCTATVTVVDVTAPTVVCQTTTVELSSDGVAVLAAAALDGGSTDACGIVNLAISQTDFACADVGTVAVTLTATDAAGLSASCTVDVTVIESTNPVAGCKDISIDLDAAGNASILAAQINDGSTDACGLAQLSIDIDQFDCDDAGANDVVLTITNSNGNTSTCTAIVTVNDVTAPNAVCQDITRALDPQTGTISIEQWDVNNGSYDACRIVHFNLSKQSFDCSDVGNNVITLTLTDANGLTDECTANVMIVDETAPTLFCQDMTVTLSADLGRASITAADVTFNVTDACGVDGTAIDIANFDCDDLGENTVTLTATDVNDNSTSCTAIVTVEDNTAPTVVCRDVTITVDANGNATLTPNQVDGGSFDNCDFDLSLSQTSFGYADYPSTSVTLTGTDEAGNTAACTAAVKVIVPCDNVTDGGSIGESETGCGSFDPAPITSLAPASGGGNAPIEYLWLSTTNPNLHISQWDMAGTSETIDPGTINQTTYYLRCARRLGCEIYEAESNVISKIVNNQGEACAPGDETVLLSGDAVAYFNNTWVSHPANLLGPVDGESALFYDYNDNIRVQLPDELPAGSQVTITWKRRNYGGHSPARMMVYENSNSGNGAFLNDIIYTRVKDFHISSVITLRRDGINSLWIRNKPGYADFEVDAITYCATSCISEIAYCTPVEASTEYEYINRVKVGSINNWSGDDNGYGDYTNLSTNLTKGRSSSIRLTPGFYGHSYIEYWKVYIDFDQDGEFESHEEVYRGRGRSEKRSNIYVPSWARSGETRMRVIMKYGGYGHPCSDRFEGEMEDYTVYLTGDNSFADGDEPDTDSKSSAATDDTDKDLDLSVITDRSDAAQLSAVADMKVYPNPTNGPVTVALSGFGEQEVEVTITNQLGQVIIRKTLAPGNQELKLDAISDKLVPGSYLVLANDGKQRLARQLIVVK